VTVGKSIRLQNRSHKPKKKTTIQEEIEIIALGIHGDGIGILNGKIFFVPFALIGEKVLITKEDDRVKIDDILRSSTSRIRPICSHFTHCGGCVAQHLVQDSYLSWKKRIVSTALLNQGIDVEIDDVIDAHGIGRRRVTLNSILFKGDYQVGFMRARSNDLFNFKECPILEDTLLKAKNISYLLSVPFKSFGKNLKINITAYDCGLDCNIQILKKIKDLDQIVRMELARLAIELDLARVSISKDIISERRSPMLKYGNAHVYPPPNSFLQATSKGEKILGDFVLYYSSGAKKVVDLFCGIGSFTLRLAITSFVLAIDVNQDHIKALSKAIRHSQGLKPIDTEVRDLFLDPFEAQELKNFDCVIFNPPRSGAKNQAIEIAKSQISTVIAVSCDSFTFARDTSILINGGYNLKKIIPIDQFKYSRHIEIVAIYKKS